MKPGPAKQFDPEVALAAAVDVFAARGYEAASLAELMKAMGINKKSLYDTFGNKRSLFLKALESYSKTSVSTLRASLLKQGSPLKNLKAQLECWKGGFCSDNSKGCLFGTNIADFDTSDAEIAQILRLNLARIEDVLAETIERAQIANELSEEINARQSAQMLLCFYQGSALVSRVLDTDELLEGSFSALSTFLK